MAWNRQMVLRKKSKIGGITLFDLKLYKEAAVVKTSWPWCKHRHADLWDKMGALTNMFCLLTSDTDNRKMTLSSIDGAKG